MKILISGGSGLLGRKISETLRESGHVVAWLGRRRPTRLPEGILFFAWNPSAIELDPAAVSWAEGLINLAGASIGETCWDMAGKELILNSRLQSVQTLIHYFADRQPLQTFLGISGAGYYGQGNQAFRETDPPGNDFPAQVAVRWEQAYQDFYLKCKPAHFSIVRMAVVLATEGGALPKMMQPFKARAGAILGSGKQPFNWIHLADAAGIFAFLLAHDGIFNASAPAADNNEILTRHLASVLRKPLLLPSVPAFVVRLALGDRASLVLEGNYSDVSALKNAGYSFKYSELRIALEELVGEG